MGITCVTGRFSEIEKAFENGVSGALARDGGEVIVLVPAQITLQTEMRLLKDTAGSFRLQVLSPARLHMRVFEEAGSPAGVHIDREGRVILMRASILRRAKDLHWYDKSAEKQGFADKAVTQVEAFKQAGLTPQILQDNLEGMASPVLRNKLRDIATLFAEYESRIQGRFLDGEDEARFAMERMGSCSFLQDAEIWLYGFDMISPILTETLVRLAKTTSGQVNVLLVADDAKESRDRAVYRPVMKTYARLRKMAEEAGVPFERNILEEETSDDELRILEKRMFALGAQSVSEKCKKIQTAALTNPQAEADFVAGLVRHMAMKRNWRWKDMAIAVRELNAEYADALRRAFQMHDVPLFLETGRPTDHNAFARFFLAAVRMAAEGITNPLMLQYMQSGYSGISEEDADAMANYALTHNMRQSSWLKPLQYDAQLAEKLESVRENLVTPIAHLQEALRENKQTKERLRVIYNFLEDSGAIDRLVQKQDATIRLGKREWAAEGAQVYNRIIAAMDQMAELLSDEEIALNAIADMFEQSLSACEVKQLPQSPDAVHVGQVGHMKSISMKGLFIMGMSDMSSQDGGALLDEREKETVENSVQVWLGPDANDRVLLRNLGIKSLLALPTEYLFASYPTSDSDGKALQEGDFIRNLHRIFPSLKENSRIFMTDRMRNMCLNARNAALAHLPVMLNEETKDGTNHAARKALSALRDDPDLDQLRRAGKHRIEEHKKLSPQWANKVYSTLNSVSASRLETFANCPFSHFAKYALRPEEFKPYALMADETGTMLHENVEEFVRERKDDLGSLSEEEAQSLMLQGLQAKIDKLKGDGKLLSAVSCVQEYTIRRVIARAARTIVRHQRESSFTPTMLEEELHYPLDNETILYGRVDRADIWDSGSKKYLRVIDYKSNKSGKTVNINEVYNGVQLQLPMYLEMASRQMRVSPAGAFYFGIRDPLVNEESHDPEKIAEKTNKELRLNGFMLQDKAVVQAMSATPKDVLGFRFTEKGEVFSNSNIFTEKEMAALLARIVSLCKDYIKEIREGVIAVSPLEGKGDRSACTYCKYKIFCQYDKELPGGEPRAMGPKLDISAIRELLSKEGQKENA